MTAYLVQPHYLINNKIQNLKQDSRLHGNDGA